MSDVQNLLMADPETPGGKVDLLLAHQEPQVNLKAS